MKATKVVRGVLTLPLRLRSRLAERSLGPPTERERSLIEDFRAGLADAAHSAEAAPWWAEAQKRLTALASERDPREFTRWDIVQETMFLGNRLSVADELRSLKRDRQWRSLWQPAIRESAPGRPQPYFLYPASSGNLIHHAYHLLQLTQRTGIEIDKLDLVFEFGGGYGSMRRLVHNLGFAGHYMILDLPPFSHLQKLYLGLLGISTAQGPGAMPQPRTMLTSDVSVVDGAIPGSRSLFIATWSLSETPTELRGRLFEFLKGCGAFLIAYQHHFAGVDNVQFFADWRSKLSDAGFECSDWEIDHTPGNRYFLGYKGMISPLSHASWIESKEPSYAASKVGPSPVPSPR